MLADSPGCLCSEFFLAVSRRKGAGLRNGPVHGIAGVCWGGGQIQVPGIEKPPELLFGGFVRRGFLYLRLITGVMDLLIANKCFASVLRTSLPQSHRGTCAPPGLQGRCEASSPSRRWLLKEV